MLSPIEKMLFIMLALFALGATYVGFRDMYLVINRGEGKLHFSGIIGRAWKALRIYITQETTLKTRRFVSLIHWGVVIGFTFYFLVNAVDVVIGMVAGTEESLQNLDGIGLAAYDAFRLIGDVLARPACRAVTTLQCTITHDNEASWGLFTAIARRLDAQMRQVELFEKDAHFDGLHDSEYAVSIGPFSPEKVTALTSA